MNRKQKWLLALGLPLLAVAFVVSLPMFVIGGVIALAVYFWTGGKR